MKKNDLKTLATVLGTMGVGLALTKKVKNSNHHRRIQGSFNKQQKGKPVFNVEALYRQSGLPYIPVLGVSGTETWEASPTGNMFRIWETAAKQSYPTGDMLVIGLREAYQNSIDAINEALKAGEITRGAFTVHVQQYDDKSISISFSDNGIGMSKDTIKNAFLSLGDTGKQSGIGGFGYAKAAILFSSGDFRFSIRTRDIDYISDSWEKPGIGRTVGEYRQGTTITVFNIKLKYAEESSNVNLGTLRRSGLAHFYDAPEKLILVMLARFQQVLRMNTEPDNIDVMLTYSGYAKDGVIMYGSSYYNKRYNFLLYQNRPNAEHAGYLDGDVDSYKRRLAGFSSQAVSYQEGPIFANDAGSSLMVTGHATPDNKLITLYDGCEANIRLFGKTSLQGFDFKGYVIRLGSGDGDRQIQFVRSESNEMFPGIVVLDLYPTMRPQNYFYPLTNSRMDFKNTAESVFYDMFRNFLKNIERMDYTFDKRLLIPIIIPMRPNNFVDHRLNDPMILDHELFSGQGHNFTQSGYFWVAVEPIQSLTDFTLNYFKEGKKDKDSKVDVDCALFHSSEKMPFVRDTFSVLSQYYVLPRKFRSMFTNGFQQFGLMPFNPTDERSGALYDRLKTKEGKAFLHFWYGVAQLSISSGSREMYEEVYPYLVWGESKLPFKISVEFSSIDFLYATTQLLYRGLHKSDQDTIRIVLEEYSPEFSKLWSHLFVEWYMNNDLSNALTEKKRIEWCRNFDWTNKKLHKQILSWFAPTAYFRFPKANKQDDTYRNFLESKQRPRGFGTIETQTADGILMALAVPWTAKNNDYDFERPSIQQQQKSATAFTRKTRNKYNLNKDSGLDEMIDVQRFAMVMNDIRSFSLRRGNISVDRGALYNALLEHVHDTRKLEKKIRAVYEIKSPTWSTYYDEDFASGAYATPFGTNCVVNVESDFKGFNTRTFSASSIYILPALTIFNNGMYLLMQALSDTYNDKNDSFSKYEDFGLNIDLFHSLETQRPIVGITNDSKVSGFNQGFIFSGRKGQVAINPSFYERFRKRTVYCEELAVIIMRLIVHEFAHYHSAWHNENFTQADAELFNFVVLTNLPYRLAYIIRSIDPSTSWRNMGSMSKEQIIHKQRQMAKKYTHAACPKCKS